MMRSMETRQEWCYEWRLWHVVLVVFRRWINEWTKRKGNETVEKFMLPGDKQANRDFLDTNDRCRRFWFEIIKDFKKKRKLKRKSNAKFALETNRNQWSQSKMNLSFCQSYLKNTDFCANECQQLLQCSEKQMNFKLFLLCQHLKNEISLFGKINFCTYTSMDFRSWQSIFE